MEEETYGALTEVTRARISTTYSAEETSQLLNNFEDTPTQPLKLQSFAAYRRENKTAVRIMSIA
jgi:hypothetical protein